MNSIPRLTRWIFSVAFSLFVLLFVLRMAIWWSFHPATLNFSTALRSFWMGFRYDAREVSIVSLLLLLTGSVPFLHPFSNKAGQRVSLVILLISLVAIVIFYSIDFLHFRYLLQRLNASALSFLSDARISGSMVWQTYPVIRILLAMLISIFFLYWLVKRLFKRVERSSFSGGKFSRISWGIVVLLLCAVGIFGRVGQYPLRWSDAFSLGSDFKIQLALNPFQSFFSSLNFRNATYDEAKLKQYYPLMTEYLGMKPGERDQAYYSREMPDNKSDSVSAKPNIVLVICESFSAYKSSMWGNPLNTTPYFNELCKKGIFFDNCYTPAFGTARGVWATITGIPDVATVKTASRSPLMVDQHTIINDFDGYEKFYFLGGSTSWANIRGVLTNNIHGLHLYEQEDFTSSKIDVWGISDKNLFLESNNILKEQRQPFFAVIQTADNHRPYTIPAEDKKEFTEITLPVDSLKKYGFNGNDELNAFRYTDFSFRKFMEVAQKEKYFDNTIFMFIGDHGIGGNAGAMFPAAWTDNRLTAYHVPLLFYSPRLLASQRIHAVASQVDVLPTLAGLAHTGHRNTTLGRDLLAQMQIDSGRSNIAFIVNPDDGSIGVVNGPWYYTCNPQTKLEKMVWADFSRPEDNTAKDSLLQRNREYAFAFFETSRYMLLNNKKSVMK